MPLKPTITGNLESSVYYDWAETKASAAVIARNHGLTKNTVIGHAWRRRWPPRAPLRTLPTLDDRLDACSSRLEAALSGCSSS
jgi:hypothetical protein